MSKIDRTPKYANSEQTCEALIQAAGELAADKGFANVSTRAVASRAGANISSIHYHFGGKDGLFEAIMRRIIDHYSRNSYRRDLFIHDSDLDTPIGQARAIAAIINEHAGHFFDPETPWWYSKYIYQALQYENELYHLVNNEFIVPMNNVTYGLLETIKPGISREEKVLLNALTLALFAMHSDYRIPILHTLGAKDYDMVYIGMMRDLVVRVVQQALGLPVTTGERNEETA